MFTQGWSRWETHLLISPSRLPRPAARGKGPCGGGEALSEPHHHPETGPPALRPLPGCVPWGLLSPQLLHLPLFSPKAWFPQPRKHMESLGCHPFHILASPLETRQMITSENQPGSGNKVHIHPSTHPFYPATHPSTHPPIHLSIYPSTHTTTHPSFFYHPCISRPLTHLGIFQSFIHLVRADPALTTCLVKCPSPKNTHSS